MSAATAHGSAPQRLRAAAVRLQSWSLGRQIRGRAWHLLPALMSGMLLHTLRRAVRVTWGRSLLRHAVYIWLLSRRLYQSHSNGGWAPTSAFEAGAEVKAVSWRQHSRGAPAMLLVATDGGDVAIWAFQAGFNTWQRLAVLGDGGDELASALCWAPLTGRNTDTVAVGTGRAVSLWDVAISKEGVQVGVACSALHAHTHSGGRAVESCSARGGPRLLGEMVMCN